VAAGANEIVLTGVDSTSWGRDLAPGLGLSRLVERVLDDVPDLRRLRLSTLDPAEVDDRLVACFAEPRIMPHVHLSLQSGDALVLKRMRRRHAPGDAVRLVARLKAVRPDVAIGADLIAGFPTEGEAAHRRSLAALEACDTVHAHVFPYSPRPGTAAARMPQTPAAVARERAAELRAAAAARKAHWLRGLCGTVQETVSEGAKGYTPAFAEVRYRHPRPRGALIPVVPALTLDGMLGE
jgi:threonylcarbamoyladenosine tRNA methylthiotransferase MtaB